MENTARKIDRKIQKFDATNMAVGRLATKVAIALRGKDKPEYQHHIDAGDFVEVTNINKLVFTGKKVEQKKYYHHSGFPGGLKERKMSDVLEKNPGEVLARAVRQMLPGTKLRTGMLKRLIIK